MLHIIYRTCGGEDTPAEHKRWRHYKGDGAAPTERTEWFDKRIYFTSFAREVDDEVKVTVVYDGDKPLLRDYIVSNWIDRHRDVFALHQVHVGNNRASLLECYKIADSDQVSDHFYFLEDDYLHRQGWLKVLREGFDVLPADALITLYDHPDRYTRRDDVTSGQDSIRLSKSTHWRTAESTTCTCAIRRSLWPRVRDVLRAGGVRDRETFRSLIQMGVRVWQPIPGYSTHDHVKRLSPLVDWRRVSEALSP